MMKKILFSCLLIHPKLQSLTSLPKPGSWHYWHCSSWHWWHCWSCCCWIGGQTRSWSWVHCWRCWRRISPCHNHKCCHCYLHLEILQVAVMKVQMDIDYQIHEIQKLHWLCWDYWKDCCNYWRKNNYSYYCHCYLHFSFGSNKHWTKDWFLF